MNDLRDAATSQLNLVLRFFDRAESRLALLLGVNLSMIALLASTAPPIARLELRYLFVILPLSCIAGSLRHIWKGFFPKLDGPKKSLVYFGSLSARTEEEYIVAFTSQDDDAYTADLLSQTWHNAKILTEKFKHLKGAFRWMLWAIAPWLYVLAMFAASDPTSTRLLGQ